MNKPQPKKPVNPLHHIVRYDDKTRHVYAWQVFVMRNKQKKSKFFTDSVYGGKEKSMKAAIRYRDELLKKTDIYALLIGYRKQLRSTNQSGIAGVSRHETIDKRRTNSRRVDWIASWVNEFGVRYRRSFSIKLYGEAEARQMAIDERERQLKIVCAILADREDARIYGCRKS